MEDVAFDNSNLCVLASGICLFYILLIISMAYNHYIILVNGLLYFVSRFLFMNSMAVDGK